MTKDLMCLKDLGSERIFRRWLTAVGKCGLALTEGIPIYQQFYLSLQFEGEQPLEGDVLLKTLGMWWAAKQVVPHGPRDISIAARISFDTAFGVDPAMQMLIEDQLRSWKPTFHGPPVYVFLRGLMGFAC